MKTRLIKEFFHHYIIEVFNKKLEWEFVEDVETLVEAKNIVEILIEEHSIAKENIIVRRVTTYCPFDESEVRNISELKDELKAVAKLLNEIKCAGYIPFTSPAPSSTECKCRDAINKAIELIEYAKYNC